MHWGRWKRNGNPATLRHHPRAGRACSIGECVGPPYAHGWCKVHYTRWWKHGDPLGVRQIRGDDVARLMSYVRVDPSGCWIWTGVVGKNGYGRMGWRGRFLGAHRVSYALLKGSLVEGLQIDHLCRVRSCVNPDHLEQVTPQVNIQRGWRARELSPSGSGVVELLS